MYCQPLVLLLLFVLSSIKGFADIFTVMSNADSGPGTLRWAIGQANANGNIDVDIINFDIMQSVFNLRIIDLTTELPAISSNIIIDASTQPGAAYGTTDARICLRKLDYAPAFSMMKIENAQNVEIYGLCLYYGYWQGRFQAPFRSSSLYGINIVNSSNIQIGAPGKGNVINGVVHGIYSNSDNCSHVTIRSNYIGQGKFYDNAVNDLDDIVMPAECCITLASVKNIIIGGSHIDEGNIFGSPDRAINIDSKYTTGNGLLRIQNNVFGRWYDKTRLIKTYDFWSMYINIGRSRNNPLDYSKDIYCDYRVELLDNDIPNDITISYTSDSIIVLRNSFVYDGRTHGAKLTIYKTSGGGIIGGEDASNANYFENKKKDYAASIFILTEGPITVLKNVFKCNSTFGSTTDISFGFNKTPVAQIDIATPNSASGRATPGSRVDLYYDDGCTACEGEVYVASVMSDASGVWTYNGAINRTLVAVATKAGFTGMFSAPAFDGSKTKIVNPTCGMNNGSITGYSSEGADAFYWLNVRTGDTVAKTIDLTAVGPGEYLLYGVHGKTCIKPSGDIIELEDNTPKILSTGRISQPSCGLANGTITDIRYEHIQNSKVEWKNETGAVIGNSIDIYQLLPGKYTLYITDQTAGCRSVSPTLELSNQSGPTINDAAMKITSTTCGRSDGSITGITASGIAGSDPFVQWVNAANQPVSNDYDLLNVSSGIYRLKFKDKSNCDTIFRSYTVNALSIFSPVTVTNAVVKDGSCNRPNASIAIQSFNIDPSGYSFRWLNTGSGLPVGTGTVISGLDAGNYQLLATDKNGCEQKIYATDIKISPEPSFNYQGVVVKEDECSLGQGSITSLKINNLNPPVVYTWYNENNVVVGNGSALQNIPAGTYSLKLTDADACAIQSAPFTVNNIDHILPAPMYEDVIAPRYSTIVLTVKNPAEGIYCLAADAGGTRILQQNSSGNFTVEGITSDTSFYINRTEGSCASALVRVVITVADKAYFAIPNAITPNNDGRNDRLPVKAVGYMKLNYFRIYNRWGRIVFETKRLNDSWDGYWKGNPQGMGTFVWIAEGKDINGNIIKDRGSFILIK